MVVISTTQLGNLLINGLVFLISILLSHLSTPNKKVIPISINNSLSYIYLHVGTIADDENKMRMLVDTGAAINTCNKEYHK